MESVVNLVQEKLITKNEFPAFSSGDTITVIGKDVNGNEIVEAITGPNATTVLSTNTFATVKSVTLGSATDANAGSTFEIGTIQTIAAAGT